MIGGGLYAAGREPRKNLPPLEAEPWRLAWAEVVKRKDLCGIHVVAAQRVPASRFKSAFTIPEHLKGTVEVVLAHDARCHGYKAFDIQSFFLREADTGWVVTSLDDWSIIKPSDPSVPLEGSVCATEDYGPDNGYCSYRAAGIAKYNPDAVRKFLTSR
jgi:hypothetical protein